MTDRLRLLNSNETPPDKFEWRCPHDGCRVGGYMDKETWLAAIYKHLKDNEHPIPDDWREQAEHDLCACLPPGWCQYGDGRLPDKFVNGRFTMADFMDGTSALETALKGDLVPREEAERRGTICAGCIANMDVPGCGPCYHIAEWIGRLIGAKATQSDPKLKACGACHCSNKVQIWMSAADLKQETTPEKLDRLQLFSHCWKWKAIESA